MKKRNVTLQNGDSLTLYMNPRTNLWTADANEIYENMDRLDAMFMAESGFIVDSVEFSRNELGVLKRYWDKITTIYSKQKIRQLANEDCARLKQFIKTIKEVQ